MYNSDTFLHQCVTSHAGAYVSVPSVSAAIQAWLHFPRAAVPLWKHTNELQVLIL